MAQQQLPKEYYTVVQLYGAARYGTCSAKQKNLRSERFSILSLQCRHMLLDGVCQLCKHRLAADFHLIVPYANEHLSLEWIWENVRVALHLDRIIWCRHNEGHSEALRLDLVRIAAVRKNHDRGGWPTCNGEQATFDKYPPSAA